MTLHSFTITEFDPAKPWIIVSTSRDSVDLPDDQDLAAWAERRWPRPRFEVKADRAPFRWAATDR